MDHLPLINGRPISELKVVDLKKELEIRSLPKSGNKKELIERLRDFIISNQVQETNPSSEEIVQGHFVSNYLAVQQEALKVAKQNADLVRAESVSSEIMPTNIVEESPSISERVPLDSSLSTPSQETTTEKQVIEEHGESTTKCLGHSEFDAGLDVDRDSEQPLDDGLPTGAEASEGYSTGCTSILHDSQDLGNKDENEEFQADQHQEGNPHQDADISTEESFTAIESESNSFVEELQSSQISKMITESNDLPLDDTLPQDQQISSEMNEIIVSDISKPLEDSNSYNKIDETPANDSGLIESTNYQHSVEEILSDNQKDYAKNVKQMEKSSSTIEKTAAEDELDYDEDGQSDEPEDSEKDKSRSRKTRSEEPANITPNDIVEGTVEIMDNKKPEEFGTASIVASDSKPSFVQQEEITPEGFRRKRPVSPARFK